MEIIKKDNEKEVSIKGVIAEYLKVILGAFFVAILIISVVAPARVIGHSMDKTLGDGDYLFVYKLAYKSNAPKYKDIVVLQTKLEGNKNLIKRVIGLPGDTIEITDNILYINGEKVEEAYINEKMLGNQDIKVKIPEGKVFVMGDNRNHSLDSRNVLVGLIDYKEDVIGKVIFRLFPFEAIPKY